MTDKYLLDRTDAFAAVAGIDLSATDLDGVLKDLAELAKRAIPGAVEVSVTLRQGGDASTVAFTGGLALSLDETQYEQGRGPGMDALASGDTLVIDEMGSEDRWPDFTTRALDAGCHSSLSVGLPGYESASGVLNIYAIEPKAFDEYAIVLAQAFAGHAVVALANARLYDVQTALAGHLDRVRRPGRSG
ncbi:GAF domain-containing protein [Plantactinospora sp. CA-290183]|uniref:GAF domain-containing protein n=1 Tax=Plantactinospora sp. CA-290183 TaxID=3240006 RepID=UPI003D8A290A